MIRIVRGIWRGQVLRSDLRGVRPTPSLVREALMNILADRLPGAVVWDLFSGTGSFGINCVSCGAEKAVFLDKSSVNLRNISEFFAQRGCPEKCLTVKAIMPHGLRKLVPPADVVFMDPPYADTEIYSWAQTYPWSSLVRVGGVVVVESGGFEFVEGWRHRRYGGTHIHIMEVE